jgi:hypothetical protein
MPFYADDKNLSHIAKMLPPEAMCLWCETATKAEGDGKSRNDAVLAAWDAIGKDGWKRHGKKYRKDSPAPSDVHVDAPLGGKKPKGKKPNLTVDDLAGDDNESEIVDQVRVSYNANKMLKVDDSLGIVVGWAIVCKEGGQPYFDLQGDHIPEDTMMKAAADFMQNSRVGAEMHKTDDNGDAIQKGSIVFAFPLTADIAKAMDIQCPTTGLMIGYKPDDKSILNKFKDGSFTGFSIGGYRLEDETVG